MSAHVLEWTEINEHSCLFMNNVFYTFVSKYERVIFILINTAIDNVIEYTPQRMSYILRLFKVSLRLVINKAWNSMCVLHSILCLKQMYKLR